MFGDKEMFVTDAYKEAVPTHSSLLRSIHMFHYLYMVIIIVNDIVTRAIGMEAKTR
jgi:hypothetical protein